MDRGRGRGGEREGGRGKEGRKGKGGDNGTGPLQVSERGCAYAHNPQTKLASQIAAKRCQIKRWFVLITHENIPSPYPTLQYHRRPPGAPFPKKAIVKN